VRHILRTEPGAVASKPDSQTALHYAALQGHAEICRVLLAAKAEVDASVSGLSALKRWRRCFGQISGC
jgi:ankyrin repeat protein